MVKKKAFRSRKDGVPDVGSGAGQAMLSIIAMNRGRINEIRFKRIYLERYSLWELQHVERELIERGILTKEPARNGHDFEYKIPNDLVLNISNSLATRVPAKETVDNIRPQTILYCSDYPILLLLWKWDLAMGGLLLPKKSKKESMAREKVMEEMLALDGKSMAFLRELKKSMASSHFLRENGCVKWTDVLSSPHTLTKAIFRIAVEDLRGASGLGKGDVGQDNMDFVLDELARLKMERWHRFSDFVSHARGVLYSANQPFRWIHFDEESVWGMLHDKVKLLGIVETHESLDGERAIRLTSLGAFCLDRMSQRSFQREASKRKGPLLVHPNFEVMMVERETNPAVVLQLAMFTEPVTMDTATVLKITRDSVEEGLRLGLKTRDMIEFLEKHSKGGIPQNVEYSITDWAE